MHREIRTILVDDEAGCIDNLAHYLGAYCPRIQVAGLADTPQAALDLLRRQPVDLAFLDVHLFDQNIFDTLANGWPEEVPVVLVTAYECYALQAFKAAAIDFLVKPLDTGEVVRCYRKILKFMDGHGHPGEPAAASPSGCKAKKLIVRHGDHVYVLHPDNVVMLKANGFYTEIYFEQDGKLKNTVVSKPINRVHQDLDTDRLIRVHRSYVINLKKVTGVRRHGPLLSIEVGTSIIPVAKRRAGLFMDRYNE